MPKVFPIDVEYLEASKSISPQNSHDGGHVFDELPDSPGQGEASDGRRGWDKDKSGGVYKMADMGKSVASSNQPKTAFLLLHKAVMFICLFVCFASQHTLSQLRLQQYAYSIRELQICLPLTK